MRQAVVQATHHAAHRSTYGCYLIEAPPVRNVLADLALEAEAATARVLRLARACNGAVAGDGQETVLKGLRTAIGKYWVCKRALPQEYSPR